jgi:predicted small secreted protein
MKNFKKILVFLSMAILLSGCNTLKKGFTPDKRSGEEFLVEKKSPLVMPPDFNELPIPNQEKVVKENRKSTVKSLISGSNDKTITEENNESISSIEKLILKQIKKN